MMSVAPTSSGFDSLFGNIGSVGNNFAGAVSDIFAAQGDQAEAQNYELAAGLATQNEQYTQRMTQIRSVQSQREVANVIGKQEAGYAGGNIAESGSALDVLRSSVQQGGLQNYIINAQGAQQEAAYAEQAQSYQTMASAAQNAAEGSDIAGVIKGVAGVAGLFALL
jgi:hypothetical protein